MTATTAEYALNVVRDASVDNTGIADCTAKVQQALLDAAMQGVPIFFPAGKYAFSVSTWLHLPQGTRWIASPKALFVPMSGASKRVFATNYPTTSHNAERYTGAGNITISGGRFDEFGSVFRIAHAEDIQIEDVVFNAPETHAIELAGVRGARVRRCRFQGLRATTNAYTEAVQLDGAFTEKAGSNGPYDSTVTRDVLVEACWFGPSEDGAHQVKRGVGSHSAVQWAPYEQITIRDCTFLDTADYGIGILNPESLTIERNRFEGGRYGVVVQAITETATPAPQPDGYPSRTQNPDGSDDGLSRPVRGITLRNNLYRNLWGQHAIYLLGYAPVVSTEPGGTAWIGDVVIEGEWVDCPKPAAGAPGAAEWGIGVAVDASTVRGAVIRDSHVEVGPGIGFRVRGQSASVEIASCRATATPKTGFVIDAGSVDVRLRACTSTAAGEWGFSIIRTVRPVIAGCAAIRPQQRGFGLLGVTDAELLDSLVVAPNQENTDALAIAVGANSGTASTGVRIIGNTLRTTDVASGVHAGTVTTGLQIASGTKGVQRYGNTMTGATTPYKDASTSAVTSPTDR